jgi:hypothetical protein
LSAALQTVSLTESALDFVKAGNARPALDTTAATPIPPSVAEEPRPAGNGLKPHWQIGGEEELEADAGLVSLTVRVPRGVPTGLLLASMDRKLKRQRPWTQQEIVAEALTQWLKQHGYLS